MHVIPLDKSSQSIPVLTIGLLLLNCLVFFGFQTSEDEGYSDAMAFSQASGLLRMESTVYKMFLQTQSRTLPEEFQDDLKSDAFFNYMMQDDAFQYALLSEKLIKSTDPAYKHWQELRAIFEADLDRGFNRNYGYSPARGNYGALLTSMFLHNGFWQCTLNMVLLWFVGSLLEIGLGRLWLGCYVLAGFVGSALFGMVFPISQGPLVGSGAALAGVVGLYGLLFSRTRLRAVHSLKYKLNYPKVPGWFLLPIWGVVELIAIITSAGASGAYVAHIGGLVVGLCFGGVLIMTRESEVVKPVMVESKDAAKVDDLLEQIDWHLAVKRFGEARELVVALLRIDPKNKTALIHLFNLDKKKPASDDFRLTATMVLGHLATIKGSYDIEAYFEEYLQLCPSAKVPPDLLLGVATSYIHSGKTESASRILAIILKVAPENVGLPACLFNLAQMYRAGNQQKKAKKCLRILAAHYPETNSGRKAKEFLSPQLHHTFGNGDNEKE